MPRPVVPILPSPLRASRALSTATWYGRISGQISEICRREAHVQAGGFQLFDFLEQRFRGQHDAVADIAGDAGMHDARGIRRRMVFLPLIHSVWPAL